jgi:hypothetical protein
MLRCRSCTKGLAGLGCFFETRLQMDYSYPATWEYEQTSCLARAQYRDYSLCLPVNGESAQSDMVSHPTRPGESGE